MLFNQKVIDSKIRYLDVVLATPELVERVVARHVSGPFQLVRVPRFWEPGGGSTLFRIETADGNYLLKIKHQSVGVEMRLESEKDFPDISPLMNEYRFYRELGEEMTPRVLFFDEEDGYEFLAVENLERFDSTTEKLSAVQLLKAWERIAGYVRTLYDRGIVHIDIHEQNICFRNETPILCDFEEARYLRQEVGFADSLDVKGENCYGQLCSFVAGKGRGGRTCLIRLREVFKKLIRDRLPELIAENNFDHTCPFNRDADQEPDSRIYQSLDFPDLRVAGQRPKRDERLLIFKYFLCKASRQDAPVRHLDIGSNLGVFCFEAAAYSFVGVSTGLEACVKYVEFARVLAFLYEVEKARFQVCICGEERVETKAGKVDFVTMLSTYHHVVYRDNLLADLKGMKARYLLGEFATQEKYYPERGDWSKELEYILAKTGYKRFYILGMSNDYRRPIVMFSREGLGVIDRILMGIIFSRFTFIGRWMVALAGSFSKLKSRRKGRDADTAG